MSDKPIASRRGCEWDDFNNSVMLLAVCASAEAVADALARRYKSKTPVEKVDPTDTSQSHPDLRNIVFCHEGQPYSVFYSTDMQANLAGDLSKALKTRAISLVYEDTAGCTECGIFDSGKNVEIYSFGPTYADEMASLAEELGEEAAQFTSNKKDFDHVVNIDDNEFCFRSQLRKVSKDILTDTTTMLNELFVFADAWMPGWAHFPFSDPENYPNEPQSQFVSALRVRVRPPCA